MRLTGATAVLLSDRETAKIRTLFGQLPTNINYTPDSEEMVLPYLHL